MIYVRRQNESALQQFTQQQIITTFEHQIIETKVSARAVNLWEPLLLPYLTLMYTAMSGSPFCQ